MEQPRHAQSRVGALLKRVQVVVIDPFENAVDGHQTLQGFEVNMLTANHQVIAFNQRESKVACEKGVLKIGFVVVTWGQKDEVRVGTRRA